MSVAVVGMGVVGSSLAQSWSGCDVRPYDPDEGYDDEEALKADYIFICVPTPFDPETGLNEYALRTAVERLPEARTVVIRSTVPPGTTDRYQAEFPQHKFLHCPEFLTEHKAYENTVMPARQIIGYTAQSIGKEAAKVKGLLRRAPYTKIMPAIEAEMVKYFANAYYALKVTYANQMYDLCQRLGVDYEVVKKAGQADPMMGAEHLEIFHKGYRGYGGKCLPKDVSALLHLAKEAGIDLTVLEAASKYNEQVNDG